MTTGQTVVRVLLGLVGVALLVGGITLGVTVGAADGAWVGAGWMIISGSVLLIAVVIEVSRYRSASAELDKDPAGPGGGEPGPLDARFQRTDEVFVDPTSNRTMRVFVDANTGERRYVAEG
jgi:hypothetical protein